MLQKTGESDQVTQATGRIAALDRVRTFTTLLVVIHHSVVNYTFFGNGDRIPREREGKVISTGTYDF
jgi:uncharacterized membrane protein